MSSFEFRSALGVANACMRACVSLSLSGAIERTVEVEKSGILRTDTSALHPRECLRNTNEPIATKTRRADEDSISVAYLVANSVIPNRASTCYSEA